MKALIQRVTRASVTVEGQVVGSIRPGLLIFLGIHSGDTEDDVSYLADKCANLRIFSDSDDKFNLSLIDTKGEALVVSQFTLYGDARKGRRPSFTDAAPPEISEPLYEKFIRCLQNAGITTASGTFGAKMQVELLNDGPVTLILESK